MQNVLPICSGTEWEFDMKKKLIQATCLFFVMMLIFTILSRVSDSVNVIQIQTKNPANQMITHEVKGSGKVEGVFVAHGFPDVSHGEGRQGQKL